MQFHPESPILSDHDLSRLKFIAEVKHHLHSGLAKENRRLYEVDLAAPGEDRLALDDVPPAQVREVIRTRMEAHPFFRGWSSSVRAAQDLMWAYAGEVADANADHLAARIKAIGNQILGSVSTTEALKLPDYIAAHDTHRMPGSYYSQTGPEDLRAGVLYDLGGAIYQLGLGNTSGALLNDSRGRTVVAHLKCYYPDVSPSRILDMGCSVGNNTLPLCAAFPQAEVHAIDIGAPMIRYAQLRATGLGAAIRFDQQDAERTEFEDGAFDLVVSQIVLHETSPAAARRIIEESYRLVRPGGVVVHLEVPIRFEDCDPFDQFSKSWEEYYNEEPNISWVASADFEQIGREIGLSDVKAGFQAIPRGPDTPSALSARPLAGHGAWYVFSGRKPLET